MNGRRWALVVGLIVGLGVTAAVALARTAADGPAAPSPTPRAGETAATPSPDAAGRPLHDRTLKADLFDDLPSPPELVVLGGSRAMRFEPSYIRRLTGLSAFNFAVRTSRPEDSFAIVSYMISRAPQVKLRVIYPLQTTAFDDGPLHPVLLEDERFARWFPPELVRREKARAAHPEPEGIPQVNRYDARGGLLYNGYDEKLERGVARRWVLHTYIERLLPKMVRPSPEQTRSKRYFEKVLALCNEHGVVPAVILMPYHPEVLKAFRAVGWQDKHDALVGYLRGLQPRYDLAILDYTDIASFGGDARFFYDGSHLMKENSRRLLRQAVRDAPECF